jgi:hypothetical protein
LKDEKLTETIKEIMEEREKLSKERIPFETYIDYIVYGFIGFKNCDTL